MTISSDLEKVQQDGLALQFVKKQTPEICMAAVQKNGCALQYVKKQTQKLCMAAVQQTCWALKYVEKQTPKICMTAVQQDGAALKYVKIPGLNYTGQSEETEEAIWADVCKHAKLGLDMDQWHGDDWNPYEEGTCGTTHCLAGWVQALSTDPEIRHMDPLEAGLKLIPRHAHLFYKTNEEVLKEIDK